jgi:hypothetical protein
MMTQTQFHSDIDQEVLDCLILCLPYIESALDDPHYKPEGISKLIARIEKALDAKDNHDNTI